MVSELVEHLDLSDAVLVGQDWGGPIGIDVASRDPDRCTGLVLGDTFFFPALRLQRAFGTTVTSDIMGHQVMQRSLFVRRMLPTLLQTELTDAELAHDARKAIAAEAILRLIRVTDAPFGRVGDRSSSYRPQSIESARSVGFEHGRPPIHRTARAAVRFAAGLCCRDSAGPGATSGQVA
ncbi:alpha/beta fold hydrolase [Ilumatobacter sp.]|uniref:alpha/beta fold hydrolase n=1 Tax=Ilumatobacter sp. TaxID=1967498 RepID=UPI00345D09D9